MVVEIDNDQLQDGVHGHGDKHPQGSPQPGPHQHDKDNHGGMDGHGVGQQCWLDQKGFRLLYDQQNNKDIQQPQPHRLIRHQHHQRGWDHCQQWPKKGDHVEQRPDDSQRHAVTNPDKFEGSPGRESDEQGRDDHHHDVTSDLLIYAVQDGDGHLKERVRHTFQRVPHPPVTILQNEEDEDGQHTEQCRDVQSSREYGERLVQQLANERSNLVNDAVCRVKVSPQLVAQIREIAFY